MCWRFIAAPTIVQIFGDKLSRGNETHLDPVRTMMNCRLYRIGSVAMGSGHAYLVVLIGCCSLAVVRSVNTVHRRFIRISYSLAADQFRIFFFLLEQNLPSAYVVDVVHAAAKIFAGEILIAAEHFAWQTFR